MSRWKENRVYSVDIPQDWKEAEVFLSDALRHLLNSGRQWHEEAASILIDCRGKVLSSDGEDA